MPFVFFSIYDYSSIYNNQDLEQEEQNKHMHQMYIIYLYLSFCILYYLYTQSTRHKRVGPSLMMQRFVIIVLDR